MSNKVVHYGFREDCKKEFADSRNDVKCIRVSSRTVHRAENGNCRPYDNRDEI